MLPTVRQQDLRADTDFKAAATASRWCQASPTESPQKVEASLLLFQFDKSLRSARTTSL